MLSSKSAELSKLKGITKSFIAGTLVNDNLLALSVDGILFYFDKERKLVKQVVTKLERGYTCCVTADDKYILCGGWDGQIKAFSIPNLDMVNA